MVLRFINAFACDFENAINLGRRMKMINVFFKVLRIGTPLTFPHYGMTYELMGLRVIL